MPALSTYITNAVSPLDTYKLYYYGQIPPLVLCSNDSSAEYSAPSISTQLLDVPNAAKIAVQYAYTPYHLNLKTASVTDCGTGTCTPAGRPENRTIYYRLDYLDVNGVLLENSDVQTL